MGAISAPDSIPVLKEFLYDSERSVRETCGIAIARIEWENSEEGRRHCSQTSSESHVPCAISSSFQIRDLTASEGFTPRLILHLLLRAFYEVHLNWTTPRRQISLH